MWGASHRAWRSDMFNRPAQRHSALAVGKAHMMVQKPQRKASTGKANLKTTTYELLSSHHFPVPNTGFGGPRTLHICVCLSAWQACMVGALSQGQHMPAHTPACSSIAHASTACRIHCRPMAGVARSSTSAAHVLHRFETSAACCACCPIMLWELLGQQLVPVPPAVTAQAAQHTKQL
jgi:hypothetical protein